MFISMNKHEKTQTDKKLPHR